jgi:hypothetical protein
MPVIGYLSSQSADDDYKNVTVPFRQGLKETGYDEGQNVAACTGMRRTNMIVCRRSQPISSAAG